MRAISLGICLVLGGLSAAHGATDPRASARSCAKPTRLYAFTVETEWASKSYAGSEKAVVEVTVTRPAPEDPGENGIPMPGQVAVPQEGATVSTTLFPKKRVFPPVFGRGLTDEDGRVRLPIPLKEISPGRVDASTYAELWTNEGGCPDIEEWGQRYDARAFTVRG